MPPGNWNTMAVYEYKAIMKASGKPSKGVIDAESPAQARQKLRDQDLYPTHLTENANGAKAKAAGRGQERGAAPGRLLGRISTRDLAMMTRQLAVLLRAGMPLVAALAALLEQTSKPRLKTALYDIRDRINSGGALGDAMAEHPKVFSELFTNMVRAGEVSGTLEEVLVRLADMLEQQAKIKSQILASLAYPVFMGFFAVAVVVFLMMVIVPRITKIFMKQEAELPWLTKALIAGSDFLGSYWYIIVAVIFGVLGIWRTWIGSEKGRRTWDRIKLKFPLYGNLHRKLVCARFARTMGTMLKSGLTMLPAIDVVTNVLGNAHLVQKMDDVKAGVRRGRDLATPMRETGFFPSLMIQMVDLGQKSGEIEDMMLRVSETYDEDVRLTIGALVSLLEPIIIIFMGIFVGLLVTAILLPILQMSSNL